MPHQTFIIFPHHLFEDITLLREADEVYLVEEWLYFEQYAFHQQKLVFHRASMKQYEKMLQESGITVRYIPAKEERADIRKLVKTLAGKTDSIHCYDPCDDWLQKRLSVAGASVKIKSVYYESALYINSAADLEDYFQEKTTYFLADFYTQQRRKFKILVDQKGKPAGGRWSHDADNRLKYPKAKQPPPVHFPPPDDIYREAVAYVKQNYPGNYGSISEAFMFPITHALAKEWLQQFFETRFAEFGPYEDAIVADAHILHHSVLTPMLNTGLLTPKQVVNEAIRYSRQEDISLNSLEGFIRQLIGWREFIRGVYLQRGSQQRTTNYWKFTRKIPSSFYTATTGIEPIDSTIKKLLATGYCHHIERLMILGNFMLLCAFDPDEVYRWFMEMFIDAYDWVMVPNIYGMSQFADGGLMATKPYISASSYILKMSNYKKGEWCTVWDALFWTFMNRHRDFFLSNPRLGMLINSYDKMSAEKKKEYEAAAGEWLKRMG